MSWFDQIGQHVQQSLGQTGQAFGDAGRKVGQFGHWLGDVTGLNGAPQVNPYQFDWTNANQTRGNETALLNQYQQMAAGNGPSLAQGQLQQATDQNIRQAMALGAAQQGQGLGYASALRGIADQSAQARQQAAAQSALIRNAEQMQAMGAQGALLGQIGGQDFQQQGMGAQNAQYYGGLNANIDAQNAAGRRQFFGGIINAAGGLLSHGLGGGQGGGGGSANVAPGTSFSGLYGLQGSAPLMSSDGFRGSAPQLGDFGASTGMMGAAHGGQVPGYAEGGGPLDSKKNDTVPAMLSPGEIVIPRSITMHPHAGELSRKFVEMVQQHRARLPEPEEHPVVRGALSEAQKRAIMAKKRVA